MTEKTALENTRTLSFYGSSDDNFVCMDSAGSWTDEIGCYDSPAAYRVSTPDGWACYVVGHYAPLNGMPACWSVGLCPADENRPLPPWPQHWSLSERGYSALLTLLVPADVECVPHKEAADA